MQRTPQALDGIPVAVASVTIRLGHSMTWRAMTWRAWAFAEGGGGCGQPSGRVDPDGIMMQSTCSGAREIAHGSG
jgi:hypothetical protein